MAKKAEEKKKLALVYGTMPTVEEVDQFKLIADEFDISVVSTESICGYLNETSRFHNLRCLALPDHDENPTYIPGLENVLADFDVVIVKERLGLYAFQAVKAKWKSRFRLAFWVDNLAVLPAQDVGRMRTIRDEVTNGADAFLVQSDTAKQALLLEGIEEERVVRFRPWVEKNVKRTKKARAEALERLKLPESSIVVAHFGQIEWEEGLLDLVSGVKLALEKKQSLGRRIKLIFCGIGSFAPQLRETMVALGMDDCAAIVAPSREAFSTILQAADAVYVGSTPARDRVEGDPYRILSAMVHEIPLIGNRSPLIDEYCGKHRFDFCYGSPKSIFKALDKLTQATALRNNIVKKNAATVKAQYSQDLVAKDTAMIVEVLLKATPTVEESSLDHRVLDVESLVNSKQYLKAIDLIESIFKVDSIPVHHKANLYRLVGDCFAKLSDNDSAKDAYLKATEIDPYSAKAYIGLGTVALVKQSHDIAVLHFQKAVSLAPKDEMANLGLGLAFQGMGELNEAQSWVLKALEINPRNSAAIYTLVRISYDLESYNTAEGVVRKYLDLHPNDHNMVFTLGGILFKQGSFEDVVALCEDLLAVDPHDPNAKSLYQKAQRELQGDSVTKEA